MMKKKKKLYWNTPTHRPDRGRSGDEDAVDSITIRTTNRLAVRDLGSSENGATTEAALLRRPPRYVGSGAGPWWQDDDDEAPKRGESKVNPPQRSLANFCLFLLSPLATNHFIVIVRLLR
jgi:hypothetical protein